MKCAICGKDDIKPLGFGSHLKQHNYTNQQYYDEFIHESDGKCLTCGKPTRFVSIVEGYKQFCCQKCSMQNENTRQKISERTKAATEEIKQRNLEKYGVEWTTQLESQKEKSKQTMLKNYGVDSAMKSEELREKHKSSIKKHYGVEYAQQSDKIKTKTKETCLEKYGVESPVLLEDVHKKAMELAWTDEARTSREQTCLEKYGSKTVLTTDKVKQLAHTEEVNKKRALSTRKTMVDKYNVSCGYLLTDVRKAAMANIHSPEAEKKRVQTMLDNNHISNAESLFMDLANLYELDYIQQYYNEEYPYLCDFYIPSKKLYVEINVFWTHGHHWFLNSEEDKQVLNEWTLKDNKFYNNAIYTWTDLDVRKRNIAKQNNLNYITLWTLSDINAWFLLDCPDGKDYEKEYSWYSSRELKNELSFGRLDQINRNVKYVQFDEFYKRELKFWSDNSEYKSNQLNEQLKLYENRLNYIHKSSSELTDLEILRGLNISGKIKAYTMFSNVGMLEFIDKYKPDAIYDPCAGWGERLLTCAIKNIKYYGYDINTNLKSGYNKLIDHFGLTEQVFRDDNQANINDYDCLFTCPPYYNVEVYTNKGAENLSYEKFLIWWKLIIAQSNCNLIAYQINQKYKNDMNQAIIELGYSFVEEIILPQRSSHFTRKNGNQKKEFESIQIFRREIKK